jgi:hypothetical protein
LAVLLTYVVDYIKKENCTAEAIVPIIAGIKVAVNDGLVKINALAGVSADIILAGAVDADVKVTVSVLAAIVADLIVVSILWHLISEVRLMNQS